MKRGLHHADCAFPFAGIIMAGDKLMTIGPNLESGVGAYLREKAVREGQMEKKVSQRLGLLAWAMAWVAQDKAENLERGRHGLEASNIGRVRPTIDLFVQIRTELADRFLCPMPPLKLRLTTQWRCRLTRSLFTLSALIFCIISFVMPAFSSAEYVVASSNSDSIALQAKQKPSQVYAALDITAFDTIQQLLEVLKVFGQVEATDPGQILPADMSNSADYQANKAKVAAMKAQLEELNKKVFTSGRIIFVSSGTKIENVKSATEARCSTGTITNTDGTSVTVYISNDNLSDSPDKNKNSNIQIEDTETFFAGFSLKRIPPARSEFETDDEYNKRLPTPWDSTEVVYFVLRPDCNMEDLHPNLLIKYSYDIKTQLLTVASGSVAGKDDGGWHPKETRPLELHKKTDEMDDQQETNAAGATVNVSSTITKDYVLYLHGTEKCPKGMFDSKNCVFNLQISMTPQDGKDLVNHTEVVIGTKLLGYKNAFSGQVYYHVETFDQPYHADEFRTAIEGILVKVMLMDTNSGKIVKEWDVK